MAPNLRPDIKAINDDGGGLFKRMLRKTKPTKLNPVGISSKDVFSYIDSAGIDPNSANAINDFQRGSAHGTPHTTTGASFFQRDSSMERLGQFSSKTTSFNEPSTQRDMPISPEELAKINPFAKPGTSECASAPLATPDSPISPESTLSKKRSSLWRKKFSLSNIRSTAAQSLRNKSFDVNASRTLPPLHIRHAPSVANMNSPSSPPPPPQSGLGTQPALYKIPDKGEDRLGLAHDADHHSLSNKGNKLGALNLPSPLFGSEDPSWPNLASPPPNENASFSKSEYQISPTADIHKVSQPTDLEGIDQTFLESINRRDIETRRQRRRNIRSSTVIATSSPNSSYKVLPTVSEPPVSRPKQPNYVSVPVSPIGPAPYSAMTRTTSDIGRYLVDSIDTQNSPMGASAQQHFPGQGEVSIKTSATLNSTSTTVVSPQNQKRRAISEANEAVLRGSMAAAARAAAGYPKNSTEANIPPVPPLPHFVKSPSMSSKTELHEFENPADCNSSSPSMVSQRSETESRRPSVFSVRTATCSNNNIRCDAPVLKLEQGLSPPSSKGHEFEAPRRHGFRPFSIKSPTLSARSMATSSHNRDNDSDPGLPDIDVSASAPMGLPVGARSAGDNLIRRKIRDQLASSVAFDQLLDDQEFTINISLS